MKLKLFLYKWIDLKKKHFKVFDWREWRWKIVKLCGTVGTETGKSKCS